MYSVISILIMILVTNGLRVMPVTLIRKKITNTFLRSFLYYVPYVTLAVMTVPAILNVTTNQFIGLFALLTGIAAAWFRLSLFYVSAICCITVFILELLQ